MTDFKDDKPNTHKELSFKEQILAELEEANRLRKQREAELYQKELEAKEAARKTAELKAQYEAQKRKEAQEAAIQAEKERLEAEAQAALAQNQIDTSVDSQEIDQVLENIDQAFKPKEKVQEEPAVVKDDDDCMLVRTTEGVGSEGLPDMTNIVVEDEHSDNSTEIVEALETSDLPLAEKEAAMLESAEEPVQVADTTIENEEPAKPVSHRNKQKNNHLAKRIALTLISAIVVVLLAIGFFGYRYVSSAVGALDSKSSDYVTVEIPAGSGNKYIGQILEDAGVIKSATVFNYYTKFKNYSNFQSGYYNFQASMDLDTISKMLQEGGTAEPEQPALGKILLTEGYTIKQIAKAVATNAAAKGDDKSTPFKAADFLKVVQDEDFIAKMQKKYPDLLADLPSADKATYRLEGYLFPATYNYYEETTLEGLVEQMISTMNSYMTEYYDTIASSGHNVNEILTLASLVEKEGSTDEDRRNIASVFYNRINTGMALQSNIAILYAQGKLGDKTTLAEDASIDTSIDSPYNIYTNTGLMPGPVDSPSLSAIKATISPASTDYYYFVADVKTGTVYYAETYEEHEKNVEKYVNSQINQ